AREAGARFSDDEDTAYDAEADAGDADDVSAAEDQPDAGKPEAAPAAEPTASFVPAADEVRATDTRTPPAAPAVWERWADHDLPASEAPDGEEPSATSFTDRDETLS